MEPSQVKKNLELVILRRFYSRWHMALIVLASLSAGLVSSKLLLHFSDLKLLVRYPVSVMVSYIIFLIGLSLWLRYAGIGKYLDGRVMSKRAFEKDAVWQNIAQGHFETDKVKSIEGKLLDNTFSGATTSIRTGLDIGTTGFGEISGIGCVFVLFGIFIYFVTIALYAAGFLLIIDAPVILAEIVFEAILAAGLVRAARRQASNGWLVSAFSVTWPSLAFVMIFAVLFALFVNRYAPEANSIPDLVKVISIKYGKS